MFISHFFLRSLRFHLHRSLSEAHACKRPSRTSRCPRRPWRRFRFFDWNLFWNLFLNLFFFSSFWGRSLASRPSRPGVLPVPELSIADWGARAAWPGAAEQREGFWMSFWGFFAWRHSFQRWTSMWSRTWGPRFLNRSHFLEKAT